MQEYSLQQKSFLALLALVTVGFFWILAPYAGAVFWGIILAILFAPVYRWLLHKTRQKPTLASLLTLLLIIIMVILPLTLVGISLVDQASGVYEMLRSGDLSVTKYFQKIMAALPQWVINLLERF